MTAVSLRLQRLSVICASRCVAVALSRGCYSVTYRKSHSKVDINEEGIAKEKASCTALPSAAIEGANSTRSSEVQTESNTQTDANGEDFDILEAQLQEAHDLSHAMVVNCDTMNKCQYAPKDVPKAQQALIAHGDKLAALLNRELVQALLRSSAQIGEMQGRSWSSPRYTSKTLKRAMWRSQHLPHYVRSHALHPTVPARRHAADRRRPR